MIIIRADGDLCECAICSLTIYLIVFIVNIELYYSGILGEIKKVTNRDL